MTGPRHGTVTVTLGDGTVLTGTLAEPLRVEHADADPADQHNVPVRGRGRGRGWDAPRPPRSTDAPSLAQWDRLLSVDVVDDPDLLDEAQHCARACAEEAYGVVLAARWATRTILRVKYEPDGSLVPASPGTARFARVTWRWDVIARDPDPRVQ